MMTRDNWILTQDGFDIRTAAQSDVLSFNPKLPAHWAKLAFPIIWKGTPVYVEIEPGRIKVTNRGSLALDISVVGRTARVAPGERGEW